MLFDYLLEDRVFMTESKAFRNADTVRRFSKKELSEILFTMMLTLHLLSKTRFNFDAISYATQTVSYPLYDRIYLSTTDTANLISTLKNAKEYLAQPDMDLPTQEIKRYLRDFRLNSIGNTQVRSLFYKLQTRLKISNSYLMAFRRDIVDGEELTWEQQQILAGRLYQQLRRWEYKCDILVLLQKFLDSKE